VLAELNRLRDAGVVRLVDALVVTRRDDGSFDTVDEFSAETGFSGHIVTAVLGTAADPPAGRSDVIDLTGSARWSLADAVPNGTTVVIGLIEHLWARGLTDAIAGTGGTPVEETWLAPEDRARVEQLLVASS
jgi:hypothetical protein